MEIYIQGNRKPVPAGGAAKALDSRVTALEGKIQEKLDSAKVTDSTAVTQAGYAADARQLNPAVPGTAMHMLSGLRADFDSQTAKSPVSLGFIERPALDNVLGLILHESAPPWTSVPYTASCDETGGQRMLVIGIDGNGSAGGAKSLQSAQVAVTTWGSFMKRKIQNGVWTDWETF